MLSNSLTSRGGASWIWLCLKIICEARLWRTRRRTFGAELAIRVAWLVSCGYREHSRANSLKTHLVLLQPKDSFRKTSAIIWKKLGGSRRHGHCSRIKPKLYA